MIGVLKTKRDQEPLEYPEIYEAGRPLNTIPAVQSPGSDSEHPAVHSVCP